MNNVQNTTTLRRPWRFSLRAIFVVITLAAISITVHQRRSKINSVVDHLISKGAKVEYHPDSIPWIGRFTGHFFSDVRVIDLKRKKIGDEDFENIGNLKRLERIYLPGTNIGREGIAHLTKCKNLKRLSLWSCYRIGDQSFEEFEKMQQLEVLDVHKTRVTGRRIAKAAAIPALRHLIFTAKFSSDEDDWINSDTIQSLSGFKATPVGQAYCLNFNDDDLARFASFDTSRLTDLFVRDGQITGRGLSYLRDHELNRLELQVCPVTDTDLDALNWNKIMNLSLYDTNVTLAGIAERIGEQCNALEIYDDRCYFKSSSKDDSGKTRHRLVRIDEYIQPITRSTLQTLSQLNELKVGLDLYPSICDVIEEAQPKVQIEFSFRRGTDGTRFWEMIERTPSLKGLGIWNPPSGLPRFTPQHRLGNLWIRDEAGADRVRIDYDFMQEVSKLSRLRFLWIQNGNRLGTEIEPLEKLTKLDYLRLQRLTDDAIPHLLRMKNLSEVDANDCEFSAEGIDQLNAAVFKTDFN